MRVVREMRGVIPNYHHSFNLFFFLFVLTTLFSRPLFSVHANTLSSAESLTISSNRTIVSLGDHFELGFFKPAASLRDSDGWYLGIWYKTIPKRTYVWVANRDKPLSNFNGTLKISGTNLVLLDQSNSQIWSTNLTGAVRAPVVAELLANGNFVLRDSKSNGNSRLVWQSFDYPTDTLLPQMKLGLDLKTGRNRGLTSWKNSYDPSSGPLSFKLDMQKLPELFMTRMDVVVFRSGLWNGIRFNGLPDMQTWKKTNISYNVIENKEEVVFTYRVTTPSTYSRLQMSFEGMLQLYTWNPTTVEWDVYWMSWKGDCDFYYICSSYSYCNPNTRSVCNCLRGFKPRNQLDDPPQCDRKTQLTCTGDGFHRLMNMKLPDTEEATVEKRVGLKECEERCRRDCNCTAFANTGGIGCVLWKGELRDIQSLGNAGEDLYVRLAAADLG